MRLFRRKERGIVDLVALSPEGDRWMVAIVHDEPWEEDGGHLLALQERVNDCLAFITGGQMDELYPESVGERRFVQVFHVEEPDPMTAEFFTRARTALEAEGIGFETELLPPE